MKKYLFIAAAALTMMAGCNKYKVEVGNPTEKPIDDDAPVAIELTTKTAGVEVKTKGSGMVIGDEWDAETGKTVYVYGVVKSNLGSNTTIEQGDLLVSGEDGLGLAATAKETAITLPPVPAVTEGEKATPAHPWYYTEGIVYDFYGYYIDDASVTLQNGKKGQFDITIDGTQDIMVAKAAVPSLSGELSGREDLVFSSWTARRGVKPSLAFNHMLTAATFTAVRGNTAQGITVNSVTLNVPTTGTLVVIPDDTNAEIGAFAGDTDASITVQPTTTTPPVLGTGEGQVTNATIGTAMLFAGETSYNGTINFTQDGVDHIVAIEIPAPAGTGPGQGTFTAGTNYNVKITVHGASEISIETSIVDWIQYGEDITVDNDVLPGTGDEEEEEEEEEETTEPTIVTSIDGTTFSYTTESEGVYALVVETAPEEDGTYFVDGETVTAWVIATEEGNKSLTKAEAANKVTVNYTPGGATEASSATIYYAAANLAEVGEIGVAAYTSATDIPVGGVSVKEGEGEGEITYTLVYSDKTLTVTTGN